MLVTLLGMTLFLHPTIRVLLEVSIMALQLLRESYFVFPSSILMEVRPVQLENASYPMLVTLAGIETVVKLSQFRKADFPMLVTLLGILTEVRPLQPSNAYSPMLVTPSGITYFLISFPSLSIKLTGLLILDAINLTTILLQKL